MKLFVKCVGKTRQMTAKFHYIEIILDVDGMGKSTAIVITNA